MLGFAGFAILVAVIKADGHVDDREMAKLKELIEALDMPKAYSNGVLVEEDLPAL